MDRVGTWDTSRLAAVVGVSGPHREGEKPMMNRHEESDPAIVAVKSTNKAEPAVAICSGTNRSGVGGSQGQE
jgi:hypothetical protein